MAARFTRQEIALLKLGRAPKNVFKRYYKSDHWRKLRERKLALNPTCEMCRRRKAKQIHHVRYSTLFNEDVNRDLLSSCGPCHKWISTH